MKRKKWIIWTILSVLTVAVLSVAGTLLWQKYYDRKVPNFGAVSQFYVYPGTSVDSLEARVLREAAVLKPGSLKRAFRDLEQVQPGHYTLTADHTSMYAARMFSHGWQSPVRLVLSGTIRKKGVLAKKIAGQMMLDSADVREALRDSALLADLGWDSTQVFSLFLPDTYEVLWTESMPQLMGRMKKAYETFWTPENRMKAEQQQLTLQEVSILASIVNGETNHVPEMPRIAGVYLNRLRKGMKLQADPTVAYCFGYTLNRILKVHLKVDSPFNTYRYAGLPPAPIAVPTKAALEAVLNAESHRYLYFCASPEMDGTHFFAENYTAHLRNARAFQRALTKKLKEKGQ